MRACHPASALVPKRLEPPRSRHLAIPVSQTRRRRSGPAWRAGGAERRRCESAPGQWRQLPDDQGPECKNGPDNVPCQPAECSSVGGWWSSRPPTGAEPHPRGRLRNGKRWCRRKVRQAPAWVLRRTDQAPFETGAAGATDDAARRPATSTRWGGRDPSCALPPIRPGCLLRMPPWHSPAPRRRRRRRYRKLWFHRSCRGPGPGLRSARRNAACNPTGAPIPSMAIVLHQGRPCRLRMSRQHRRPALPTGSGRQGAPARLARHLLSRQRRGHGIPAPRHGSISTCLPCPRPPQPVPCLSWSRDRWHAEDREAALPRPRPPPRRPPPTIPPPRAGLGGRYRRPKHAGWPRHRNRAKGPVPPPVSSRRATSSPAPEVAVHRLRWLGRSGTDGKSSAVRQPPPPPRRDRRHPRPGHRRRSRRPGRALRRSGPSLHGTGGRSKFDLRGRTPPSAACNTGRRAPGPRQAPPPGLRRCGRSSPPPARRDRRRRPAPRKCGVRYRRVRGSWKFACPYLCRHRAMPSRKSPCGWVSADS